MKVTKVIYFLFLFLCVFSVSCESPVKRKTTNAFNALEGTWSYQKVLKDGVEVKKVAENDIIQLGADSSFFYFLLHENIYATGTWNIASDSILNLSYDFIPNGKGSQHFYKTDTSLVYVIGDDTISKDMALPVDTLMADAFVKSQNKLNSKKVRSYFIEELDDNHFVISEKGIFFSFTKKK